jgi:tetratricopeptide (TPR) repeat protein
MNCRPLGVAAAFILVLMTTTRAAAQRVYSPSDVLSDSNITVHISGPDNKPLKQQAFVTLYQRSSSLPLGTIMTTVSSEAVLTGMPGYGWYTVTVTSAGYRTESKDFEYNAASGRVHVDVTLQPVSRADAAPAPGGTLPPKAREQMQKGLEAIQAGKFQDAIKEFQAAYDAAPKNGEVCYLLGAAYQKNKDLPNAQTYLEKATSIDPENVQALVALGQLRDQKKDYKAAIAPLEKAAALDGSEWLARWVLADAYFRTGEYEKARKSAEEAVEIGKGAANKAELIEGQALAQLGRREDAIKMLEAFLHDLPGDPAAPAVRAFIDKLQSGTPTTSQKPSSPE